MPTLLETTIVALTVQVGARDIDSICHETGMRVDTVATALESLGRRKAIKRTMSGRFQAHQHVGCGEQMPTVRFRETLRP